MSSELDDLYVVDGRRITPITHGFEFVEQPKTPKVPEASKDTYEEHYETYEEYCIHQQKLTNQGITMCDINQDITQCSSCPYRKSRTMRCKVSSIQTA